MHITTLGAGREIGRSCFLVTIADTTVLLDAGVHMNPQNKTDRIPIIPNDLDAKNVSAVVITHYHLDHIGALPYLTEMSLNACPEILMSVPTKLLAPNILLDYCKGPANSDMYSSKHVWDCFGSNKLKVFGIGEQVRLKANIDFVIDIVYAGHVVGGVMLLLKYMGVCVVYTGDFSVVPDALLNPITIPPMLIPKKGVDIVISESTHATTITPINRPNAKIHADLCHKISSAINRGGTVLIPLFAVGRTQEIASIIRMYLGPSVALFTTSPGGFKSSLQSSTIHRQWLRNNEEFDDLNIQFLESDSIPNKCVIFASPAMIEGGSSMKLFKHICTDPSNLVVVTGYCSKGTIGNSVILFASKLGMKNKSVYDGSTKISVECECLYTPFSNHTDSVGIEKVLAQLRPRMGVVLVHGEFEKMKNFKDKFKKSTCQFHIPENYETLKFDVIVERSNSNTRSVSITKKLNVTATMDSLFDIISERLSYYGVEKCDGRQVVVSDSRTSITLSERHGCIHATWICASDLGAEWISNNPIVSSIEIAVLASNSLIENFSISSCSGDT